MNIKKLMGFIRKADLDFKMIDDNDRIAIGVSGGKDSMLLLYALNMYKKIAKKYDNKNFEVVGIHLNMGFPDMDFTKVREFFKTNEIEYYDIDTKIYEILKLHLDNDNNIKCSLCSTLKKGAVINEAKLLNCNKTAFAHHSDDAVETLFLNMIYGGRIATFAPKMHLSDSDMTFIRPFIYVDEKSIKDIVSNLNLPLVISTCPNDKFTQREEIKNLLNKMYCTYPMAKKNFVTMLSNTDKLDIWNK